MKYLESIGNGVQILSSFGNAGVPHFLCCVNVSFSEKLEELILEALRKNEIRSAILTVLQRID